MMMKKKEDNIESKTEDVPKDETKGDNKEEVTQNN